MSLCFVCSVAYHIWLILAQQSNCRLGVDVDSMLYVFCACTLNGVRWSSVWLTCLHTSWVGGPVRPRRGLVGVLKQLCNRMYKCR